MVTVQFTLGREGSNGDSSSITLLGSAGYKTALSYSFEGETVPIINAKLQFKPF